MDLNISFVTLVVLLIFCRETLAKEEAKNDDLYTIEKKNGIYQLCLIREKNCK